MKLYVNPRSTTARELINKTFFHKDHGSWLDDIYIYARLMLQRMHNRLDDTITAGFINYFDISKYPNPCSYWEMSNLDVAVKFTTLVAEAITLRDNTTESYSCDDLHRAMTNSYGALPSGLVVSERSYLWASETAFGLGEFLSDYNTDDEVPVLYRTLLDVRRILMLHRCASKETTLKQRLWVAARPFFTEENECAVRELDLLVLIQLIELIDSMQLDSKLHYGFGHVRVLLKMAVRDRYYNGELSRRDRTFVTRMRNRLKFMTAHDEIVEGFLRWRALDCVIPETDKDGRSGLKDRPWLSYYGDLHGRSDRYVILWALTRLDRKKFFLHGLPSNLAVIVYDALSYMSPTFGE